MLTDFYELTMISSDDINPDQEVVFDLYYRKAPCGGQFAIAAGLEQAIDYLQNLTFTEEDLAYLKQVGDFDDAFLERLRHFTFTCDVYAVPEGTIVFPGEPLMRVQGPWFQAQFVETALLLLLNHQTLIATKSYRITHAAKGDVVLEFGTRRAQGADAALYGTRASYIGGCHGTANVMAGKLFDIPVRGTHSHSWVQRQKTELDAFRLYADKHPDNCILLVDTYDVIHSGIPNAIKVGLELKQKGYTLRGIRIDSGDLAYLSKQARKMLDEAGLTETKIVASSDLDEYLIRDLKAQGAAIDMWGVGTNLITSHDCPSLGGVYKISAIRDQGEWIPKIKVSENPKKITNPGVKKVVRLHDRETNRALVDLIMLEHETIDESKPLEVFDPVDTWKRKVVQNFKVRELLQPVFKKGKLVYDLPSLEQIRDRVKKELQAFSEEQKRLTYPHKYHVDLSEELWHLKQKMIREARSPK
ncbi:MAG: nicotinate phosphoribosyltransferase [Bacillaceae bacterium]|nr:nicotinate phosphoribosyltransferase [Bacillaceae bacterium]